MKSYLKLFLAVSIFFAAACKDKSSTEPEEIVTLKIVTAKNINANVTGKTYYRFSDSTTVTGADTATNKWDIAFNKTTIYTNSGMSGPGQGGALVLKNTDFTNLIEAPADGYKADAQNAPAIATGSGNGWYLYNAVNNIINPAAGVVVVIKTGQGKYAKVQIISYYKGAPTTPSASSESRYYTFKYFYQPDGSRKLK